MEKAIATALLSICESSTSSSSSSSSSDDEVEFLLAIVDRKKKIVDSARIKNFVCVIDAYNDDGFRSHFRLTRNSFEMLLLEIGPHMVTCGRGRPMTDIKKQLLMCLWLLANQETYRSIADRFDVPKQTVWNCTFKVCDILLKLAPKYISWPKEHQVATVIDGFEKMAKFPGVIGAIDGTHIPIKAPINNPKSYVNRKGMHSVILQAVVDHRCIFTDCYAGQVGSVHDAHVFACSDLLERLVEKDRLMLPGDCHLLGDAAYPIRKYLLTPYRDNGHLSQQQKQYNLLHARTRSTVERAFGLLKGRFRRLKHLDVWRTDLLPVMIISCCVLHNICQTQNDDDLFFCPEDSDMHSEDETEANSETHAESSNLGKIKRDYITNAFT